MLFRSGTDQPGQSAESTVPGTSTSENFTVEAKFWAPKTQPAGEPDSDLRSVDPAFDGAVDEADLERDAPEFARLRRLHLQIEATYGARGPLDAAVSSAGDDPALTRPSATLSRGERENPGPLARGPSNNDSLFLEQLP